MTEVIFSIEDDSPEGVTSVFIKVPSVPRIGEIVSLQRVRLNNFDDEETAEEYFEYFKKQDYHFKKFIVESVEWNPVTPEDEDEYTYVNISLKEHLPL